MDRQLLDLIRINRWHRDNITSIVKFSESDPNAGAPPSDFRHCLTKTYFVKQFRGVDSNTNSSTDLFILRRLLIDVNLQCIPAMVIEG